MENEIDLSKKSFTEILLFKVDRTIAILGIIALGSWGLYVGTTESIQIAMACVGGLVGYVSGRSAK